MMISKPERVPSTDIKGINNVRDALDHERAYSDFLADQLEKFNGVDIDALMAQREDLLKIAQLTPNWHELYEKLQHNRKDTGYHGSDA